VVWLCGVWVGYHVEVGKVVGVGVGGVGLWVQGGGGGRMGLGPGLLCVGGFRWVIKGSRVGR